jgi:D-glycero-D-manno-heptose 1,7-bisphosphate phosphatase
VGEQVGVFLDRDGTLIEDVGYPRNPSDVRLLPGATAALRRFRERGLRLVVVSNQSGIGRGLVTRDEADAVHERFVELLAAEGVHLDDARYCPHAPEDGCDCRKPAPRLVVDAAAKLGLDLAGSFMVGDRARDVESGRRAGCGHLILLGAGERDAAGPHVRVARDWDEAAELVLRERVA